MSAVGRTLRHSYSAELEITWRVSSYAAMTYADVRSARLGSATIAVTSDVATSLFLMLERYCSAVGHVRRNPTSWTTYGLQSCMVSALVASSAAHSNNATRWLATPQSERFNKYTPERLLRNWEVSSYKQTIVRNFHVELRKYSTRLLASRSKRKTAGGRFKLYPAEIGIGRDSTKRRKKTEKNC